MLHSIPSLARCIRQLSPQRSKQRRVVAKRYQHARSRTLPSDMRLAFQAVLERRLAHSQYREQLRQRTAPTNDFHGLLSFPFRRILAGWRMVGGRGSGARKLHVRTRSLTVGCLSGWRSTLTTIEEVVRWFLTASHSHSSRNRYRRRSVPANRIS